MLKVVNDCHTRCDVVCLCVIAPYCPAPSVPDSALPIGMTQEDGNIQLIPVEPSECFRIILAVSSITCSGADWL